MNDRNLAPYEPDAGTLAGDDQLLDALGQGQRLSGDDPFLLALAMWREDLAGDAAGEPVATPQRHRSRKVRWGVLSAAVAALVGGGITVAAAASTAEPDSPLWPITEQVFVERASTASAAAVKVTVEDAHAAVTEQRLDEADRLLDEAETLLVNVLDVTKRLELEQQIKRVRGLLDAALREVVPAPAPPAGATPPAPAGSQVPSPSPSPDGGGLLPLPLPTNILPLPSLPIL